jgi:hypothetical protein
MNCATSQRCDIGMQRRNGNSAVHMVRFMFIANPDLRWKQGLRGKVFDEMLDCSSGMTSARKTS